MSDGELDESVLWQLPLASPETTWRLASQVAEQLEVATEPVAAALERLVTRGLAVHDAGWPRRWARLAQGSPNPARLHQ